MISIIMSTYREKLEYVERAIQSVLNQSYQDFELIIVPDDPKNDDMKELLKDYAVRDCRIKVIDNHKNLGLPGAMNKALSFAKGEYIARMDADDICYPDRLEIQLEYMRNYGYDLIAARGQCIDFQGNIINGMESDYYESQAIIKRLRFANCLIHSTWLVKKDVYEQLNGYRDIPRCEDYDFLLRALKLEKRFGMCNNILLYYRINSSGISRSGLLEQELAASYLRDNFDRLESITSDMVASYILSEISPGRKKRYNKAMRYFDQAIQMRRKNILKCGVYLLSSMMISSDSRRRIMRIIKAKLIYKKSV
jgi:glycosyltransferase involved in cell wall biosynthesis